MRVAGVTFPNPDGESRQEILKNIGFGFFTANLVQTTFENERAVEVWIQGKQVGYVPRADLDNPMSYKQTLKAQILFFDAKGIYHVDLSEF